MKKTFYYLPLLLVCNVILGQVNPPVLINNNANGCFMIDAADLDGDGDEDVVVANFDSGSVMWYENLGEDMFSTGTVLNENIAQATSVFTVDIDADGDIDVLASGRFFSNEDNIILLINDGSGIFTTQVIDSGFEAGGALEVIAADIDNDQDIDILFGSQSGVFLFSNNNNVFGSQQTIFNSVQGTDVEVESLRTADINGDGNMDVIAGCDLGFSLPSATVYALNEGGGVFADPVFLSENSESIESIIVDDIDLDGDEDIVTTVRDSITIFYNTGALPFNETVFVSTYKGDRIKSMELVDMDGDDDLDILASFFSSEVGWFENIEASDFSSYHRITSSVIDRVITAIGSDIDGDGRYDVVTGSYGDDEVNIFRHPAYLELLSVDIDSTTCGDSNGQIAIAVSGAEPIDVLWSNGDDGLAIEGLAEGEYSFTMTANNGQSLDDNIIVSALSEVLVLGSVEVVDIIEGSSGVITVNASGGTLPYAFTWRDAGGNVVSTEHVLMTTIPGMYQITVIDSNGCEAVSAFISIELMTGSSDIAWEGDALHIFPNPTHGPIHIAQLGSEQPDLIVLHDQLGNQVRTYPTLELISLSQLPSGVYWLSLFFQERKLVAKVIKL